MQKQTCPCGGPQTFDLCCAPLIGGKRTAQTAEELLRSRYTAFTTGDIDYILTTHHSKTRAEVKREEIEEWSKSSEWKGLEIRDIKDGKASDQQSTIVFCARYLTKGETKEQDHWEQSFFEKEDGQWRFLDAKGIQMGPYVRSEPKIGRNDPCSCGSGKKLKKCCG